MNVSTHIKHTNKILKISVTQVHTKLMIHIKQASVDFQKIFGKNLAWFRIGDRLEEVVCYGSVCSPWGLAGRHGVADQPP